LADIEFSTFGMRQLKVFLNGYLYHNTAYLQLTYCKAADSSRVNTDLFGNLLLGQWLLAEGFDGAVRAAGIFAGDSVGCSGPLVYLDSTPHRRPGQN
jgi:hypothetical protein